MENNINQRTVQGLHYFYISDYRPEWKTIAEEQIDKIRAALINFPWFKGIEHIGSTSIPGMAAKPVVDIMVGAVGSTPLDEVRYELAKLGYTWVTEQPSFMRYSLHPELAISIFITEYNGKLWRKKILFRDHFILHPEEMEDYMQLKRSMIRDSLNFYDYADKKQDYIKSITDRYIGGHHENH